MYTEAACIHAALPYATTEPHTCTCKFGFGGRGVLAGGNARPLNMGGAVVVMGYRGELIEI